MSEFIRTCQQNQDAASGFALMSFFGLIVICITAYHVLELWRRR